ncbi:MAG: hypothetical protein Q7S38_00035 [bacterium]|nr:hypothetical protein [bacterium]
MNIQIFPITPVFDTQTIKDIKNRQIITPLYESSSPLSDSSASNPANLLQAEASPSANATQGGILTP